MHLMLVFLVTTVSCATINAFSMTNFVLDKKEVTPGDSITLTFDISPATSEPDISCSWYAYYGTFSETEMVECNSNDGMKPFTQTEETYLYRAMCTVKKSYFNGNYMVYCDAKVGESSDTANARFNVTGGADLPNPSVPDNNDDNGETGTGGSTGNSTMPSGPPHTTDCPAGTFWSKSSCVPCGAGTSSSASASSCTPCPAGKYSSFMSSKCIECDAGTYAQIGQASCVMCPSGTYSVTGASKCEACVDGSFSGPGATSCDVCSS